MREEGREKVCTCFIYLLNKYGKSTFIQKLALCKVSGFLKCVLLTYFFMSQEFHKQPLKTTQFYPS